VNSSAVGSEALAASLEGTHQLHSSIRTLRNLEMIPVFGQETILHACLDLTEIEREWMTLDVSGHCSRLDRFRFSVAEEKRQ
jgi:hypothetical protein